MQSRSIAQRRFIAIKEIKFLVYIRTQIGLEVTEFQEQGGWDESLWGFWQLKAPYRAMKFSKLV